MKKPNQKQKRLQKKRAKKEAKRKKIRKEKWRKHQEFMDFLNSMTDEELREFLGEDYDDFVGCNCEYDCDCD